VPQAKKQLFLGIANHPGGMAIGDALFSVTPLALLVE
jgi:hypothetical protein